MHNFDFVKPDDLAEISKLLTEKAGKAKLAAGCTDIIPALRRHAYSPETIVSLKGVANLAYIKEDGNVVRIGATTTMTEVAKADIIQKYFPALVTAVESVGSRLVQNSATVVGNLCNASPAADTAPPLLVYGAILKVYNQESEKEVKLSEFFVGPGKTVLNPGDVVTEIILPLPDKNSASIFIKQGKRKMLEISVLSVAVNLTLNANGQVINAAVACGAVGPTPVLAQGAAQKLSGMVVNSEDDLKPVLEILASEVSPISDIRSTGEYRKHMVGILAKRAILTCCGKGA